MRKIGFLYQAGQTKELLPLSYKIESRVQQRKMFYAMINEFLSKEVKFNLTCKALYEVDIFESFMQKIFSFFPMHKLKIEKSKKIVKIYPQESLLFNQFFKTSSHPKAQFFSKNIEKDINFKPLLGYKNRVSDLILTLFNGQEIAMLKDLDTLFRQSVYKRIKKTSTKRVHLEAPYIYIDTNNRRTQLLPLWKRVDPKKLSTKANEINRSFKTLETNKADECFLIYPKNDAFQKHIILENKNQSKIKMIPYSFTFCIR